MDTTRPIVLPAEHETPTYDRRIGSFQYRAAYARSTDSRNNHEPGQDYLAYQINNKCGAFALCDGVSQSFYGDLAARIVGNTLLQWAWTLDFRQSPDLIENQLTQTLSKLTKDASHIVGGHPIPENIPPMVRAVLDKKRTMGSESTFIAGRIDVSSNLAGFTWMGDSRLRLWQGQKELVQPAEGKFNTNERWSTTKGPVGKLHLLIISLDDFDHLITYSDGFSCLDNAYRSKRTEQPFSNHAIDAFIDDAALRPSSDDISFLEIWTKPAPTPLPAGAETLKIASPEYQNDRHYWAWPPVTGATDYEIRLSSDNKTTLFSLKMDTCEWHTAENIDASARFISARAWHKDEPGPWSHFRPLEHNLTSATPLEESATSTSSTFGAITDSKQFQFLATSAKLASFSKRTLSFLLWSIATGALLLFLGAILLQTATGGFGK